jgi:hypothetical protein
LSETGGESPTGYILKKLGVEYNREQKIKKQKSKVKNQKDYT